MYILQWGAQSPSVKNDVPGTLYSVGICYYVLYPLPTVPSTQHHMLQMLMLTASQYMWVAAVNANNTAVRIAKASAKAQCLASVVRIGRRGWAAFVVGPAEADRRGEGGVEETLGGSFFCCSFENGNSKHLVQIWGCWFQGGWKEVSEIGLALDWQKEMIQICNKKNCSKVDSKMHK